MATFIKRTRPVNSSTSSAPQLDPIPVDLPPALTPLEPPQRKAPVRRTLGQKVTLPPSTLLPGITDRTDYRRVVERYMEKVRNPKTAIRAKCVECSGGSLKEVQECAVVHCALHSFRLGANPFHKKTIDRLAREDDDGDDEDHPDLLEE